MDLTVANEIAIGIRTSGTTPIDPYGSEEDINRLLKVVTEDSFVLPSHRRVLLCTREVVSIPLDAYGRIELRSTWARMGLLAPPTSADPGFHGNLTMEVFNASERPIIIRAGDVMWSLILSPIYPGTTVPPYNGRYQGQEGLTLPKPLIRKVVQDNPLFYRG